MTLQQALAELAHLLARGYVRLLVAEKARNDAVSLEKTGSICLDVPAPQWPPCAAPEARRT
jgi:hypothetical protein